MYSIVYSTRRVYESKVKSCQKRKSNVKTRMVGLKRTEKCDSRVLLYVVLLPNVTFFFFYDTERVCVVHVVILYTTKRKTYFTYARRIH